MDKNERKVFVGIDVSKDTLEVIRSDWNKSRSHRNDEGGIAKVIKELILQEVKLVVIEPTGGYESAMVKALQEKEVAVAVVNPRQTHDFGRSMGILAKTDPIDARMLMMYGEKIGPKASSKISPAVEELQALNRRRSQLTKMLVQEKNHAKVPTLSSDERQSIKESKKFINKQIRKIDELRLELVKKHAELKAVYEALDEQDGIAEQGACVLLGEIPELGELNRGEISALVGVAPLNQDSGKHAGKRKIAGGRMVARCLLYMLTLTAIRRNAYLKGHYRSLVKRGKLKKVAIVACMRKYLIYLNTKIGVVKTKLRSTLPPSLPTEQIA